jgi:hypothetical protein
VPALSKVEKSKIPGTGRGSGRKPGSRNKKTAEMLEKVQASGLTPLEYMLSILQDPHQEPNQRFSAAVQAAPYIHPKLAQTAHTGPGGGAILFRADAEDGDA